jgi:hypothetical protein
MPRSDDLAWSDVGVWPSVQDDPTRPVECVGCGRRGSRTCIAREGLCWSCWAQEYHRRLEPVEDDPEELDA